MLDNTLQLLMAYHTTILIPLLMFSRNQRGKSHLPWRLIPAVAIYELFPVLYRLAVGEEFWICPWFYMGWYNFTYILYWVLAMGIFWWCFEAVGKHLLFFGLAAYTVQNLGSGCRNMIRALWFHGKRNVPSRLAGLVFTVLLMACFYYFFVRRLKVGDQESPMNNMGRVAFSAVVLFTVNIFHQYWGAGIRSPGDYDSVEIYGTVFSVLCTLLLLFLEFDVFEKSAEEREKRAIELLLAESTRQQELAAQNVEIINRKCHDMKHQIAALRQVADEAARDASISEIEQAIMIYDTSIKTGNHALDIILSSKNLICQKEGISFSCVADATPLSFLDVVDIYSLFGNALDNAIECVRRYGDGAEKQISLNVGKQGDAVNICLENYCKDDLEFVGGLPVSHKPDADYHGFGMKSIRYIVEKYGGFMTVYYMNHIFSLNIVFQEQKLKSPAARGTGAVGN